MNRLQENSPKDYADLCAALDADGQAKTRKFLVKAAGLDHADADAVTAELSSRCENGEDTAGNLVTPEAVKFTCQSIEILGEEDARQGFVGATAYGVSTTETKRAFDQIKRRC